MGQEAGKPARRDKFDEKCPLRHLLDPKLTSARNKGLSDSDKKHMYHSVTPFSKYTHLHRQLALHQHEPNHPAFPLYTNRF